MTSTARFDNWQNRLGTQAGSIDASGNVTFDNDVTVTGTITSVGNPQGLVLVGSTEVGSSVTSVELTNVFSSVYDNYRIIVDIRAFTSTGASLGFRFDNVSTSYYGSLLRDAYDGGFTGYVRTNNGNRLEIAQINGDWGGCTVSMDVFRPNINSGGYINGLYFGRGYSGFFSGVRDAAIHTGFTILPNDGTMTGGTIRVYGYAQ